MGVAADYIEYITKDVLSELGSQVTGRRMFGGYGLYLRGQFFAILADDEMYFKTDEDTRLQYKERGSKPFQFAKKTGQVMTTSYWLVPENVLEDRFEVANWARIAASLHGQK